MCVCLPFTVSLSTNPTQRLKVSLQTKPLQGFTIYLEFLGRPRQTLGLLREVRWPNSPMFHYPEKMTGLCLLSKGAVLFLGIGPPNMAQCFFRLFLSPTAESAGVSAQLGSGVRACGKVPRGFHEVLRGLRGASTKNILGISPELIWKTDQTRSQLQQRLREPKPCAGCPLPHAPFCLDTSASPTSFVVTRPELLRANPWRHLIETRDQVIRRKGNHEGFCMLFGLCLALLFCTKTKPTHPEQRFRGRLLSCASGRIPEHDFQMPQVFGLFSWVILMFIFAVIARSPQHPHEKEYVGSQP